MESVLKIAQIFAAVREIVVAIEAAMPEGGRGKEKLAAAKQLLELAGVITAASAPLVENVIAVVVGLYNAAGVFRKSPPAAAAQ